MRPTLARTMSFGRASNTVSIYWTRIYIIGFEDTPFYTTAQLRPIWTFYFGMGGGIEGGILEAYDYNLRQLQGTARLSTALLNLLASKGMKCSGSILGYFSGFYSDIYRPKQLPMSLQGIFEVSDTTYIYIYIDMYTYIHICIYIYVCIHVKLLCIRDHKLGNR